MLIILCEQGIGPMLFSSMILIVLNQRYLILWLIDVFPNLDKNFKTKYEFKTIFVSLLNNGKGTIFF